MNKRTHQLCHTREDRGLSLTWIPVFASMVLWCGSAFASTSLLPPVQEEPLHLFQLSTEDAQQAIGEALAEKGAGDNVAATIISHNKSEPLFSFSKPITVELRGLTFEKTTHRWSASLLAVSGEEVITAMPVSGRFEEVIEVPVLKRQVRSGELISEDDLDIRTFPVSRTRAETVTDGKDLIGQSPVRTLSPGRPIRSHEVSGPVLVEKDAIVQMRYSVPGMEITATGQALEDGSKGHMIAVRNLESKKIVHATVSASNVVTLKPLTRPAPKLEAKSLTGEYYAAN